MARRFIVVLVRAIDLSGAAPRRRSAMGGGFLTACALSPIGLETDFSSISRLL